MTIQLSVELDVKALQRNLTALEKKVVPAATVSSINKSLAVHKKKFIRNVARTVGVPTKFIKAKLKIYKASRRYRSGMLWTSISGIPIIKISKNVMQKAFGVKAGKRKIAGAFIATMPSGHEGIYKRKEGSSLPIKEEKIFIDKVAIKILRRLNALSFREFMKHYTPEVERRINKLRKT